MHDFKWKVFWLIFWGAIFAGILIAGMPRVAGAHASRLGWQYPSDCCSDDGKECHWVPAETLSIITWFDGREYVVFDNSNGAHPGMKRHPPTPDSSLSIDNKFMHRFEYKMKRPSGDADYHVCGKAWGWYCTFWPASG